MPASSIPGSPRTVEQTVSCLVTVSTNTVNTEVNGLVIILTCALTLIKPLMTRIRIQLVLASKWIFIIKQ